MLPLDEGSAHRKLGVVGEAPSHFNKGLTTMLAAQTLLLNSIAFDQVKGLLRVNIPDAFHHSRETMTQVLCNTLLGLPRPE